jgi:hypothetical protein
VSEVRWIHLFVYTGMGESGDNDLTVSGPYDADAADVGQVRDQRHAKRGIGGETRGFWKVRWYLVSDYHGGFVFFVWQENVQAMRNAPAWSPHPEPPPALQVSRECIPWSIRPYKIIRWYKI